MQWKRVGSLSLAFLIAATGIGPVQVQAQDVSSLPDSKPGAYESPIQGGDYAEDPGQPADHEEAPSQIGNSAEWGELQETVSPAPMMLFSQSSSFLGETIGVNTPYYHSATSSSPVGYLPDQGWVIDGQIEGSRVGFHYKGRTYYVNRSDIRKKDVEKIDQYLTGYLMVTTPLRPARSSGGWLTTIPKGAKVTGLVENDWMLVTYHGMTGYMAERNIGPARIFSSDNILSGFLSQRAPYYSDRARKNLAGYLDADTYVSGQLVNAMLRISRSGKTIYISEGYIDGLRPGHQGIYSSSSSNSSSSNNTSTSSQAGDIVTGILRATVYLRPQASSIGSLGLVRKGETIRGKDCGRWVFIEHEGKKGYISKDWLTIQSGNSSSSSSHSSSSNASSSSSSHTSSSTPTETMVTGILRATVYLRPQASSIGSLGLVRKGETIRGKDCGRWVFIEHEGKKGYISKDWLTIQSGNSSSSSSHSSSSNVSSSSSSNASSSHTSSSTPTETMVTGILRATVYLHPQASSIGSLGLVRKGETITGKDCGRWVFIEYEGKKGYISKDWLTIKSNNNQGTNQPSGGKFAGWTHSSVYVRPYKNAMSNLGILPAGSYVFGREDGAWVRFIYKGQTAYVAKFVLEPSGSQQNTHSTNPGHSSSHTNSNTNQAYTSKRLVNFALNEYREGAVRGDYQRGGVKYQSWFQFSDRQLNHSWCMVYVLYCITESGLMPSGLFPTVEGEMYNDAWCEDFMRWYINRGEFRRRTTGYVPKPGDFLLYDWDKNDGRVDHIGIVYKVEGDRVYTVEGNVGHGSPTQTQNLVLNHRMSDQRIRGYCVPAYADR